MTETPMTVIALGAHVLDTLVRPVTAIPDGQGGDLVEQIRITAAGPAGGSALVLSRLGARAQSVGAIGTDALGDMLLTLLSKEGVDTSGLVRRDGVQTSASVLPIRPDGSRPALHVIGANAAYQLEDLPWSTLDDATHLHVGGPEFLGDIAVKALMSARERGITTSVDSLTPGDPGFLGLFSDCLPHVDFLLPNDEQVLGWTGTTDLTEGCRSLLDLGVGCVAATAGGDGALVVTRDDSFVVPAFAIDVVDTTGCGDAFTAGFLRGHSLGLDLRGCAVLGCATAAQVAGGLGTDAGSYDLATVQAYASSSAVR